MEDLVGIKIRALMEKALKGRVYIPPKAKHLASSLPQVTHPGALSPI